MHNATILGGICLSVFALSAAGEDAATLADLTRTGDLICDMRVSGVPLNNGRPRSDLMLIIDEVGAKAGAARVVSSRTIGGRNVRVYAGETGVHLVEDVNESVKVTTLMGCDLRARGGRCLSYSAVMAWHFDRGVHINPDIAFRKLPGTSYAGTCEAWRMEGLRSAEAK